MAAPATPVVTDGELLTRYLGGDERSAAELVARHTVALARYLAVQGAPDEDLDDLVQESFIRAFRGAHGYRSEASFRTWLLTIGSNLLKDRRRQAARRNVIRLVPEVADPAVDPAGEAEAAILADRLQAGLGRLAPLQREVFLLRAHEGAGYGEVAAALGISEGAARVHYHHAVKRLKQWLSD